MRKGILNNRIFSNFLSLSVLQGLNMVIPLMTFPYLIRVLGPEYFGLLAFVLALINYFQIFTEYGFNTTATRDIAVVGDDYVKIEKIFNDVLSAKILLTFIGFIILTVLTIIIPKFRQEWQLYYFTFGIVIGQTLLPVWFFQGIQKMKYITWINIFSRGSFTLFIFLLIRSKEDYWIVPLLNSGGAIVAGGISLYYVRTRFCIKFRMSHLPAILNRLNQGKYMFLSELKVTLFTSTNLLILGFMKGDTAVGYFSAAERLVRAIGNLQGPFTQAIYPYISKTINTNVSEAYKFTLKITKYGIWISLIIIIPCFFFSDTLISIIYSKSMLNAVIPFQILLLIPLCSFLDNIFGKQILLNLGKDDIYFNVMLIATLFNIGLNFLLTSYYSYIGTAISLILTQILIDIGMIYFANKQIMKTKGT